MPLIKIPVNEAERLGHIDGLRGFLALMVFTHHFYSLALHQRAWTGVTSNFFVINGEAGVRIFFMITGYLFWRRLRKGNGQIDWLDFFASRFFRLSPLYWLHLALMFAAPLAIVGLEPILSRPDSFTNIAKWFAFGLFGRPDVGIPKFELLDAGVTWTLAYEWFFYFTLPIIGLCLRPAWVLVLTPVLVCTVFLGYVYNVDVPYLSIETKYFIFFLSGGFATYVENWRWAKRWSNSIWGSFLTLGCLMVLYSVASSSQSFSGWMVTTLFFVLIAIGNSFFGVLASRGAKLLGTISYSIYLIHGLILAYVFQLWGPKILSSVSNEMQLWALLVLTGLGVVTISALSYRFIEYPGIIFFQNKFRRKLVIPIHQSDSSTGEPVFSKEA